MRFFAFVSLVALTGCPKSIPPSTTAETSGTVSFRGRSIDLAPHLEGFPYAAFVPLWTRDQVLFDERSDSLALKRGPLMGLDPSQGTRIGDIDWSSRTRWDTRELPHNGQVLFVGDENNDEKLNVYTLPLDGSPPVALTSESYVYGYGVSPDGSQLAVLARRGNGPYTTCLRLSQLDGSEARDVLCDTPAMTFTWSTIAWSPLGDAVMVQMSKSGLRTHRNLARIRLADPKVELFTDPTRARTMASALPSWLDANTPLVLTDDTGFGQVGALDLRTGETRWLTDDTRDLTDAVLLGEGKTKRLITLRASPVEDTLRVIDPNSGAVLSELSLPGSASIAGDDGSERLLITWSGAGTPFDSAMVTVQPDGTLASDTWLRPSEAVQSALVHCDVTAVRFPSWDVDPATDAPRELHAFLYTPKQPLTPPTARITAFYGGANRFRTDTQIWCEAGLTTLSPAVRGSWGFGTGFKQLNDGDLGGSEIVDLFYAARFLESQGFTSDRIGVYGGSHGGYATMRALTFPPSTNGHDDSYDFGFGIAHAGFSDIQSFYETCNIPDWVVLEAGDPATEGAKLTERSPLSHVDRLSAPLLLTHGTNDSRVPFAESKQMADKCTELGKPCTLAAFEGQGHHIRGLPNQQRLWQEQLAFMETVLEPAAE